MKKFTKFDVVFGLIFFAIMVTCTLLLMRSPAQEEPVCSIEYVRLNGDTDCQQKMRENDVQSTTMMQEATR